MSACAALPRNRVVLAVYELDALLVLDAKTGCELEQLPGFRGVRGLVVQGDELIVCEPADHRFSILRLDGTVAARFRIYPIRPWHVARWGDRWLVVDADRRQLQIIDGDGVRATRFVAAEPMKDPRSAYPVTGESFVYCDRTRSLVAEVDHTGRWRWVHGRVGWPSDDLDCVASAEHVLAIPDGGQMICDTRNNRVVARSRDGAVRVIAGGHGRVGSAPRCLNAPVATTIATDGSVLIADAGNGRLLRVEQDGTERTLWGKPVVERLSFHFPRCMEPIADGWLVADSRNNRVVELNREGSVRSMMTSADGQRLFWPRFATEISGRRFLCDSRNARVLHGAPGAALRHFELRDGRQTIAMSDPHVVRAGPADTITISDTDACRLVHATLDGIVLAAWGGGMHHSASSTPIRRQVHLDVGDLHDGFVAPDGSLWIVDTDHHRILHFDRRGLLAREICRLRVPRADVADALAWPRTVELVDERLLLVTDSGNHRVVLLTFDGRLVGFFGGQRGHARGHLSDPRFARHDRGRVLITDYQNHRIVTLPVTALLVNPAREPRVRPWAAPA